MSPHLLNHLSGNYDKVAKEVPLLVLMSLNVTEGAVGPVWKGYLDFPGEDRPSAIVAKFGELDQLRHEASIYKRIENRGHGLDGIPTLIGLYNLPEHPMWGVLVQSDCGMSFVERPNVNKAQRLGLAIRFDILSYHLSRAVLIGILRSLHECGVVHGDLRRQNLLYSDDGLLCIIDFHLSYLVDGIPSQEIRTAEERQLNHILDTLQ